MLTSAAIHIHDTPSVLPGAGDADVFQKYDIEQGAYLTRGISGGTGITVMEHEDNIEIKLDTDGTDVNIVAYGMRISYSGGSVNGISKSTEEHWVIAIRGGVTVGHYDSLSAMVEALGEDSLLVASRNVLDDTMSGT